MRRSQASMENDKKGVGLGTGQRGSKERDMLEEIIKTA